MAEQPMRVVGYGEVRVRELAASVQFTDVMLRKGKYPDLTEKPPLVLGYDVVGEVDEVGPGVSSSPEDSGASLLSLRDRRLCVERGDDLECCRRECREVASDHAPPGAIRDRDARLRSGPFPGPGSDLRHGSGCAGDDRGSRGGGGHRRRALAAVPSPVEAALQAVREHLVRAPQPQRPEPDRRLGRGGSLGLGRPPHRSADHISVIVDTMARQLLVGAVAWLLVAGGGSLASTLEQNLVGTDEFSSRGARTQLRVAYRVSSGSHP